MLSRVHFLPNDRFTANRWTSRDVRFINDGELHRPHDQIFVPEQPERPPSLPQLLCKLGRFDPRSEYLTEIVSSGERSAAFAGRSTVVHTTSVVEEIRFAWLQDNEEILRRKNFLPRESMGKSKTGHDMPVLLISTRRSIGCCGTHRCSNRTI